MECVIFDVDGTLCDITGITPLLHTDLDDYHFATQFCPEKTEVADSARFAWQVYYHVVVLTARHERWRVITEKWLDDHAIYYHELIMRSDDDHRSSADYKREVLQRLGADGRVVVSAYDDDPTCVAMYQEEGIPEVVEVDGYYDGLLR